MKTLKKRSGNTSTAAGFNFSYTVYYTLKEDWYNQVKGKEYDKLYVSESGAEATTINDLKTRETEVINHAI